MEDNLYQSAYVWLVPALIILALALTVYGRRRSRLSNHPLQGRMGGTTLSRFAQPLPGDIDMIAQIGIGVLPRQSAGMQVLRTTFGLRAISLGLSGLIFGLFTSGVFGPQGLNGSDSAIFWGLAVLMGIGVADILSYELQFDRHGMVLTRFMYWRRSFEWVHLMGIDDDQHYQYVLAFSKGGRVKLLKHLVGMPAFLAHVASALDRNEAPHAGTARG